MCCSIKRMSATFPVVVRWFAGDVCERPNMQLPSAYWARPADGYISCGGGRGVFGNDDVE